MSYFEHLIMRKYSFLLMFAFLNHSDTKMTFWGEGILMFDSTGFVSSHFNSFYLTP